MLITMVQCLPKVRRDIQLCRGFVAREPGGRTQACELEIQRGIDDIRAYPEFSRPMAQLYDTPVWLRRRTAGRFVIVYTYLPPIYPCVPAAIIIRAVKPIRAPNLPRLEALPSSKIYDPNKPETWVAIVDALDDIDWDDIIATTEADSRAGRFAFNSDDYPTLEEAVKAMHALMDKIYKKAMNRVGSTSSLDAES